MNAIQQLEEKPFFTITELSKILKKSTTTLRTWKKEGKFPEAHTENQYSAIEVLDWLFKRGKWAKKQAQDGGQS